MRTLSRTAIALALLALSALSRAPLAQSPAPAPRSGWELTGIPALNFNSDEGFGYGAIVQAFNYGPTGTLPYAYTVQPTVFLTTKGRRDASVFFDAPHLLPHAWRLGAYVAREQQLATPYYGVGDGSGYDPARELAPNPYFYRFGRTGYRITADAQRPIGRSTRLLLGAGARTSRIDETPFDSGTTLLQLETGGLPMPQGRAVYARAGLVFDTRDRETGPTRGRWIEGIVQRGGKVLGGTESFTRVTATARQYVPLGARTVFAARIVAQNVWGDVPFYELSTIQGSFRDDEGLGGASTMRGWPKNRFIGKGLVFSNEELRWKAAQFTLSGRESAVIITGFADWGRAFANHVDASVDGWQLGYGGGARLAYGRNFVIALDVGHSREATAPLYIGLGYLF